MTGHFLFNCAHCGKPFRVSEQQAGMSLDCPLCHIPNQLPGLRDIRMLPVIDSSVSQRVEARNESKSILFAGGLLVTVVAAVLAISLGWYARGLRKESTARQELEMQLEQIEKLPPAQLWDVWDALTVRGLPDWQETSEVRYQKQSLYLQYISYSLYALSALGGLAILASFFPKRTAFEKIL